jgi:hypothetical protein
MRLQAKLLCCLPLCIVIPARAQQKTPTITNVAPAPSARFPASWYPPDSDVTDTMAPQTDAPYTATLVTTSHAKISGQIKAFSTSTFQARDSAGRERRETEMPRPDGHGGAITAHEVTVSDPVSHCNFRWMEPWVAPGKPSAIVTCMPRTLRYTNQNIWKDAIVDKPTETRSSDTVYLAEPLGKRMFAGLEALGVQKTVTRTDAQTGKVQKLAMQLWYSPGLKELIQMKQIIDPTDAQPAPLPDVTLTDIHRTEPDPALFYPPVTYEIKPGY